MSFKFAWISCAYPAAPTPALAHIRGHDVRFLHLQGDTPYMWYSGNNHGVNAPAITKSSSAADIALHHAQQRSTPTWREYVEWAAANSRPMYYMPDDHEWGGDNWDHTVAQANWSAMNLNCANQAEVNVHWLAGITAAQQYMQDNLPNTDAGVVIGDIPSQALVGATPPASNYPITYFRVGYDDNGNVSATPLIEFFIIDCISYRSPISATDNASKTMLGATQKAWLKARVVASTATYKVIFSNKKLTRNTGADNTDIWSYYSTERDECLAYFDALGVTSAPWLAGDRHVPMVAQLLKSDGYAADALCVCACPVGVPNNADAGGTNHGGAHIWFAKPGVTSKNVFGLGIVDADRLTLQLRDSANDSVLWSGYIEAGSNVVQYERARIG